MKPLPPQTAKARLSHQRTRRISGVLPSAGECTVLPALVGEKGLEGLLQDDTGQDFRVPSLNSIVSSTEDPRKSGSSATFLSPRSTESDLRSARGDRRHSVPSNYLQGKVERTESGASTYHLLLLAGRTFIQSTSSLVTTSRAEEEVVDGLIEVLDIDVEEAKTKVAAARTAKTIMIYECADCGGALLKAERLRDKGIFVQVTSDVGAKGLPSPGAPSPLQQVPEPCSGDTTAATKDYANIFDKAGGERPTVRRLRTRRLSLPSGILQEGGSSTAPSRQGSKHDVVRPSSLVDDVNIMPEDAVEAFFRSEMEEQEPKQPADSRSGSKLSLFGRLKGVVEKIQESNESKNASSSDPRRESRSDPRRESRCAGSKQSSNASGSARGSRTNTMDSLPSKEELDSLPRRSRRASSVGANHMFHMWDSVLDAVEVEIMQKKWTVSRKEACLLMRFMIFGDIHRFDPKQCDEDADCPIFRASVATPEELRVFFPFWQGLDSDKSGRVDLGEFRRYAERRFRWNFLSKKRHCEQRDLERGPKDLPSWLERGSGEEFSKYIFRLGDKIAQELFGKKSCASIEDCMKLLWLRATRKDILAMRDGCRHIARAPATSRLPPPPLLGSEEYKDICLIFQSFDTLRAGELSLEDLVQVGLIYPDQIEKTREDWDGNKDGFLDMQEFCEMMCPAGYRVNTKAFVGTLPDGNRVIYDGVIGSWRLDDSKG